MQCPHCSAEVDGDAAFCDECGKSLRETAVAASPNSVFSGARGLTTTSAAPAVKTGQRPTPEFERELIWRAYLVSQGRV